MSMRKGKFGLPFLTASGGVLAAVLLLVSAASGQEFQKNGFDFHWTNTVKYSTGFRVAGTDPNLALLGNNFDDADNNFPQWSIFSDRADLFSELDITKGSDFTIHVSGAGWYDTIYGTSTGNKSGTSNNFSVAGNEFTEPTKNYSARRFELLEAFLFYRKHFGVNRAWSVRVGRQTELWGTTLFMVTNGISYGMAPLDFMKAAAVPQTQAKELFMPVGQVSMHFDANGSLNFDTYYQFEERKSRDPAAGTYFAAFDAPDIGGERLFVSPLSGPTAPALFRGKDILAHTSGNFGGAVHYRMRRPNWDVGGYFLEFNDHDSQLYIRPGAIPIPSFLCFTGVYDSTDGLCIDPTVFNPATGQVGDFRYVYPQRVKVGGASLDTNFGELELAGELSFRWNMPLLSTGLTDLSDFQLAPVPDTNRNPLYAVGNMAYVNISAIYVMGRTKFFRQAFLTGEAGYNHLMKITKNPQVFDRNRSTDAYAFAGSFQPEYFQVIPDLDISLPITLGYSPRALSASDATFNGGANRGGNITPGITLTYREVWVGTVKYTHYWGKDTGGPTAGMQISRGKDFVGLSLQRSF
jgi:Protein of unknown function (DUF1302)